MEDTTYETEPVIETGMQENTDLEGEQNHESETNTEVAEVLEETDLPPEENGDAKPEVVEVETDDEKDEGPQWFQKRINKLTSKRKAAEHETDIYKSKYEELQAKVTRLENPTKPDEPVLQRASFETEDEYLDYKLDLRDKKRDEKNAAASVEQGQKTQEEARIRSEYARKFEAAKDTLPKDYEQVMRNAPNVPAPQSIIEEIKSSEYATELNYYFVRNPSEMGRVDRLSRRQFNTFFDNFESDVEEHRNTSGNKPTTQAPKPAAKPKQVAKGEVINLNKLASQTHSEKAGNAYYKERQRRKNIGK